MKKYFLIFPLILIILVAILFKILSIKNFTVSSTKNKSESICVDQETGAKLTYTEALKIAKSSACSKLTFNFSDNYFCNEATGTFWVDLIIDQQRKGCNPACVVKVSDKTAEVNWRCTGLITPQGK